MTERAPTAHPLTPAELRNVELLAQGLSYQQIAQKLNLSLRTVKEQIKHAGLKIPGDLSLKARIIHWYHGGQTWRSAASK